MLVHAILNSYNSGFNYNYVNSMASITHHHNKKTGAIYRYRVESYWDKEKKAPRNKQVYLGKVDPHTGQLVSSKRHRGNPTVISKDSNTTLMSKVVGPYLILEQISKKLKLDHLRDIPESCG